MPKARILYMSYDGMTDALGQSQVLAYIRVMAQAGYEFDIISFEKPELYAKERTKIEGLIEGLPIRWFPMDYHKKPPVLSTIRDINAGWRLLKKLWAKQPYHLIHCRGYITAILGLRAQKAWGAQFIFDMRGWWPDEKKESGAWQGFMYQPVYRYFKKLERQFMTKSNLTVSLTYKGRAQIVALGYRKQEEVMVVPTCVDFDKFPAPTASLRQAIRQKHSIAEDTFVLLYSGSLGGNYPVKEVFNWYKALLERKPDARLFLLTKTDPNMVKEAYKEQGLLPHQVIVHACAYSEVHQYLTACDAGMIVYHPTPSAIGRSPTKLGEYWACGLPVLTTAGIADVDQIMTDHPGGGVPVPYGLSGQALLPYIDSLLAKPPDKSRLRTYAQEYYSLQKGCDKYMAEYQKLLG